MSQILFLRPFKYSDDNSTIDHDAWRNIMDDTFDESLSEPILDLNRTGN